MSSEAVNPTHKLSKRLLTTLSAVLLIVVIAGGAYFAATSLGGESPEPTSATRIRKSISHFGYRKYYDTGRVDFFEQTAYSEDQLYDLGDGTGSRDGLHKHTVYRMLNYTDPAFTTESKQELVIVEPQPQVIELANNYSNFALRFGGDNKSTYPSGKWIDVIGSSETVLSDYNIVSLPSSQELYNLLGDLRIEDQNANIYGYLRLDLNQKSAERIAEALGVAVVKGEVFLKLRPGMDTGPYTMRVDFSGNNPTSNYTIQGTLVYDYQIDEMGSFFSAGGEFLSAEGIDSAGEEMDAILYDDDYEEIPVDETDRDDLTYLGKRAAEVQLEVNMVPYCTENCEQYRKFVSETLPYLFELADEGKIGMHLNLINRSPSWHPVMGGIVYCAAEQKGVRTAWEDYAALALAQPTQNELNTLNRWHYTAFADFAAKGYDAGELQRCFTSNSRRAYVQEPIFKTDYNNQVVITMDSVESLGAYWTYPTKEMMAGTLDRLTK